MGDCGHSERRAEVKRGGHGETSKLVREKVLAAQMAGLRGIVCVGETLAERKSGDTLKVVGAQLRQSLPDTCSAADIVIAYEPVWAIGSGLTPSVEQIGAVHAHIRKALTRRLEMQARPCRFYMAARSNLPMRRNMWRLPM